MSTCKEISALATDHAEGHLGPADRARFESHVAGCAGCSAWAKQLETTARVLGALPEPVLPIAMRQQLLAGFDDWARRRAGARGGQAERSGRRRLATVPALATLGLFGVLVATAHQHSRAPGDWVIALVVAVVAAAFALVWRRLTPRLAGAAVLAAAGAALVTGGQGPLDLAEALACTLSVGAAAVGTAGAAWLVLRRGPDALVSEAVGAWAVAGGLAGAGALQVTCGAHTSLPHLLAFHVGSLAAVAAVALVVARVRTSVA